MTRPDFAHRRRRYRGLVLLLTLSFVTALFATGVPALLDRSQTSSLRQALAEADAVTRAVIATRSYNLDVDQDAAPLSADALNQELNGYAARIPASAAPQVGQAWAGVQLNATLPLLAQGTDAQIDLEYRDTSTAHMRLLAGALPSAVVQSPGTSLPVFDVALSAATAKRYGAQVGTVLTSTHASVRVTGIYEPSDPSSAFWDYDGTLLNPAYLSKGIGGGYWATAALIGPAELPELAALGSVETVGGGGLDIVYCVPLDTSNYVARDVGSLSTELTGFESGDATLQLHAQTDAGPLPVLTSFQQQQTSADSVLALVLTGVAVIDAVAVLLCAQLVIGHRRGHFALLRARGQSRTQLARQVCAGLALPSLAAIALAAGTVRLALPADWTPLTTVLLVAVAAVGLIVPPTLAVFEHRGDSSVHTGRRDLVRRRRTPRRRVLEILLLVLAVAAVVELREQGLGGAQQGSNTLGMLTPILVAALATAVAVRCYPLLLRPAARIAERRGGPASFLGFTGAARSAIPLAAPAFVITLVMTIAALGGLLLQSVDAGRAANSWQALGADAVVTTPAGTGWSTASRAVTAIEAVSGVTHATAISSQPDATALGTNVAVVDPSSYAAVSADTPWPLGSALPSHAVSGPVPVLVVKSSAYMIGAQVAVQPAYAPQIEAEVVGFVTQTPVAPAGVASGAGLILVPSWAVAADAAYWPTTQILVSGSGIDQGAMAAALRRSLPGSTATYRSDLLAGYADAPLANLTEFGYLLGILLAGGLGVCGILLSLGLAAPARGRRLTLLTTLGLTPRQARGIALAETVPLAAVTALGGLLATAALPAVFGDALNLSVFTGLSGPSSLGFDPGIALLAALIALVLTALGVALQATLAGRRAVGAQLRMGEDVDA